MAGSKSKEKGKSGERELCKILQEYLGGSFIRTPSSGSFVGGQNAFRKKYLSEQQTRNLKSDIIPPDNLPKLVIECKNYKNFPFQGLYKNTELSIMEGKNGWIPQLLTTIDDDDLGFVIFKITRVGWFIAILEKNFNDFVYSNYTKRDKFIICDLIEFLKQNSDKIKQLSS